MKKIAIAILVALVLATLLYFIIVQDVAISVLNEEDGRYYIKAVSMGIYKTFETWAVIFIPLFVLFAIALPFLYSHAYEIAKEDTATMLEYHKQQAENAVADAEKQYQFERKKLRDDRIYLQSLEEQYQERERNLKAERAILNQSYKEVDKHFEDIEKRERATHQALREKDNQIAKANRATENARNAFRRLKNKAHREI